MTTSMASLPVLLQTRGLGHDRESAIASARSQALSSRVELDDLNRLLVEKRQEEEALREELAHSSTSLEALLHEARTLTSVLHARAQSTRAEYLALEDELIDYRESLVSPLSVRDKGKGVASSDSESMTLVETLQGMHARIQQLEKTHNLFGYLAKAEELSLIAKEQIKLPTATSALLPTATSALQTYLELVEYSHTVSALVPSSGLAISPFVREIAVETWTAMCKAMDAKLVATLDALQWPTQKIQEQALDATTIEKMKAFQTTFLEYIRLEQEHDAHPLPSLPSSSSSPNTPSGEGEPPCSLAILALALPLVLRFRYHFDGKRKTNRLDKPEWYFAHVLNALSEHAYFISHDVQALLKESGAGDLDAMTEFITALLRPLKRKIRASMPQLLELPSLLAHTIYQALQFDETLRTSFAYRPRGHKGEWKGAADIMLGNSAWYSGWKEAEKKLVDDKYFEIISASNAWHINEDYDTETSSASSSSTFKPTNSALRIRDLFEQVTDRYRALPECKHRLPFFTDIQYPLIEAYMGRISSATDAFETISFGLMRAVPGSLAGTVRGGDGVAGVDTAKMTNGVNGLQRLIRAGVSANWLQARCKEWAEDVFFLDLFVSIRQKAVTDSALRLSCGQILDEASSNPDANLFTLFIDGFGALSKRIEELIVKHVLREVTGELKTYLAKRWDQSFESAGEDSLSPELLSSLAIFSALFSALAASLPALTLTRLYRTICQSLSDLLLSRSLLPKVWSEAGGQQFLRDVQQGWVAASRDACRQRIRKPENAWRKLLDAGVLVSLPASSASASAGHGLEGNEAGQKVLISKVVQVAWDEGHEQAYQDTLHEIGVRELTSRKDVKAILRKRPECWR